MRVWMALIGFLVLVADFEPARAATNTVATTNTTRKVYVLPIRDNIVPPLLYLVRRGVKEAIEANADLLILDMETNGGRVDTTREVIATLNKFKGDTATYVNKDAF